MVDFSILNIKSLPFESKEEFKDSLKQMLDIYNLLKEKVYYKIIKTPIDLKELEIIEGIGLSELIGKEISVDFKKRLLSFFSNNVVTIEFPIPEKEDMGLIEYKYQGEEAYEMGYADIFDTILLSFDSSDRWDKEKLVLKKFSLNESGDLRESDIEIINISKVEHFQKNLDFFEKLDKEKINLLLINFKENYKNIFKKLEFSKELLKIIDKIDRKILAISVSILYQLEIGKKVIEDFTFSSESETVKSNPSLKNKRKFTMQDGTEIYMFDHIKNLPDGNRIYFYKKSEEKIYIGYIGPHLKTAIY